MDEIFEILKHLRDINVLRTTNWDIRAEVAGQGLVLHVDIPVSDEDVAFIRDMQAFFEPVD